MYDFLYILSSQNAAWACLEKNKKEGHNETWTLKSRSWEQGPGERQSQK